MPSSNQKGRVFSPNQPGTAGGFAPHAPSGADANVIERFEDGEHVVESTAQGHVPLSSTAAHSIVTIPMPKTHVIEEYKPGKLQDRKGVRYSDVHRTFSDDSARKNSRFRLSELTRGPLSVEAEEEARIQFEVKQRLDEELEHRARQTRDYAYREGYEAGKLAARDEVMKAAKPGFDRFEALTENFEDLRFDVFKANEELLIRMVYGIAKMVTLKELVEDKDYIRRLVEHLLERLGTRENIKVYVGTEAFLAAEQLRADLAQTIGQLKNISIELDPEIQDPGCRIESDFGEVDARIEVQLRNIASVLMESKD
ncbi:MAG: hypothetical protein HYW49_12050 [Deltaproteobacteria bacterium]|nr:hypothetical protein [Deltaproteobacteria bacterium]